MASNTSANEIARKLCLYREQFVGDETCELFIDTINNFFGNNVDFGDALDEEDCAANHVWASFFRTAVTTHLDEHVTWRRPRPRF